MDRIKDQPDDVNCARRHQNAGIFLKAV